MKLLKHTSLFLLLAGYLVFLGFSGTVLARPSFELTPVVAASNDEIPTVNDTKELDCSVKDGEKLTEKNCGIILMVLVVTNVLAGIAGLVIIAMIIWGGIQYSAAGADPNKVQAAKKRIYNALLALILFIFGFAILQWLIPGGALNGFN